VDIGGEVERVANARALVESARTNLETATERYRLGLGIVLDIVNAQTQLFNAQTSLTQAVYDYELARSNLDRAAGRFAWANPGQPVPQTAPTTVPRSISVTAPRNNR
jgi:outer membrane protein TolC